MLLAKAFVGILNRLTWGQRKNLEPLNPIPSHLIVSSSLGPCLRLFWSRHNYYRNSIYHVLIFHAHNSRSKFKFYFNHSISSFISLLVVKSFSTSNQSLLFFYITSSWLFQNIYTIFFNIWSHLNFYGHFAMQYESIQYFLFSFTKSRES